MTGRRKWVVIPGLVAIAFAATMMSAYAGSQSAAPQAPAAGTPETATEAANREAFGKAQPGPWSYSGASGYTFYVGGGIGRSPVQPVKFPHPVHVNSLKMNCAFCHNAASTMPETIATNTQFEFEPLRGAGVLADAAAMRGRLPFMRP